MYAVTGLTDTQTTELIARLAAGGATNRPGGGRPACLDLRTAVTVVLFYLRRNLAQAAIAELFGISQPTVSRTIAALEGPIEAAVGDHVPTLDDLPEQLVLIFDGTLGPAGPTVTTRSCTPASTTPPARATRSRPTPTARCCGSPNP